MNPVQKFRSLVLVLAGVCAFAAPSRAYDLIPLGSQNWKFLIATQEATLPADLWRQIEYNDSSWSTGRTPIGYTTGGTITGYEGSIATTIRTSATLPTYTSVYFRKTFEITNMNGLASLVLTLSVDDGAVAWINGVEVGRINVGAGDLAFNTVATVADEERVLSVSVTDFSNLVLGTNVLAVHAFNGNTTSSDLHVETSLVTVADEPPIAAPEPPPNAIVTTLNFINVLFTEGVSGVNAADLLINGTPASSFQINNPNDYTFYFTQPATGTVNVAWAAAHGIADTDGVPTPFGGGSWSYTLDPNAIVGLFVISEFMAENENGIEDEDGDTRDWIEIYNPGAVDSSLAGWYLTDIKGSNLWQFPTHINTTLGANRYLRVWASGKNRTNNFAELHTNFELRRLGEYLALHDSAGRVVSEFDPTYPAQQADISYGRDRIDPNVVGYFTNATPGAANSSSGSGFAPEPVFSVDSGVFTNDSIVVSISFTGGSGQIRYTTDGTEPVSTSPLYTVPLTFGTNVFIKARVFDTGVFPGAVVARTYQFLDASARNFSSKVPVIIISTSGRSIPQNVIGGGTRARGAVVVLDTFRGRTSLVGDPDYIGMAQFEIFGQTSAGFTKQPFNIELNDAYGNDIARSLLGMPEEADWKMRNPWSDKCLMNDFLAYELYEDMGNYSVRRRLVEVFVDTGGGKITYPGDYYGVLCFLEKIERDRNRVDIEELGPGDTTEPKIAGGYIIKKDKDSAGDRNFNIAGQAGHSAQTLKMHEPKPRDVTAAQVNWISNYVHQMSLAMYAPDWLTRTGTNHYSHYIDVDSWVEQHWIVEFPKQIDGYRISNFMSKKRNGKLTMSPIWDWNLAFGNANYLQGGLTNGWYWNIEQEGMNSGNHIWLRRLLYGVAAIVGGVGGANAGPGAVMNSGDPDFIQKVIDRWGALRTNVFNGDRVIARIDEVAAELDEAATRNYQKYNLLNPSVSTWPNPGGGTWHVDYVNPTTYAGIISEMKKWTRGRYNWVDSQFVRVPVINGPGREVPPGFQINMATAVGSTLYYTLDGSDPRLPGGNVSPSAQVYSGPISVNSNVRAFARARVGTSQYSWSPPAMETFYTTMPGLRITEIMYHPANPPQPSSYTDEDFEYIELRNTGGGSLNLGGYQIRGGVDFIFPNMTLAAGGYVLVVKNAAAFSALYNTNGMLIAGEFINPPGGANNLDNTGERLILEGRLREPIQDFRYDDDWYKVTDGLGFALVIANDILPTAAWADQANWRVGGKVNGTPGAAEPAAPTFPQVVISEALTHTDLPSVDQIELHNLGATVADVSHWYLSDDRLEPKKFQIPNGTTIPAGEFISFNESQFNAGGNGFALSSQGDEVYLASANALDELTGYLQGFSFGAQVNGVTFGRHVTSLQEAKFVAQSATTPNAPNAGPLIGNIVLSEIHYHPPVVFANGAYWNNSEDEFIELHNRGGAAVNLHYPGDTNLIWRLNKAVEFDFPPGTSIPAGGYLLVVNFNPATKPAMAAAFRAKFNVPAPVQIVGPFQGDLSNDEETVALEQPDTPFTNQNNVVEAPYVLVEEVDYNDNVPWPLAADGAGFALHRKAPAQYSDDPINWESTTPTPGQGYTSGVSPTITAHPQNRTIVENNSVSLSVTASGSGLRYQWRKNGANLDGQTNNTLTINPTVLTDAGDYQVLVLNNSGFAASSNATLRVLVGVRIEQQPINLTVRPPTNVTLSVTASSSTPIQYQWRFNGEDLVGQNTSVLVINNVTNVHDGVYTVVCTDDVGPVESQPARLVVLIPPIMLSPSPAAPLNITAVAGETLSFGAVLHGTLPTFARWRLIRNSGGNIVIADQTVNQHFTYATHLASNNSSGRILLSLTNIAGGSLANTATVTNALITILADTDGDRIPDVYENANGMNPNDSNDANGDLDNDTSKNRDEYIAGTNPQDPLSYLKVDRIETFGSAILHFTAVSNRTYTVQYTDALSPLDWQRLADFGGRPTNWSATAVDPDSPPQRYYRLVTPVAP